MLLCMCVYVELQSHAELEEKFDEKGQVLVAAAAVVDEDQEQGGQMHSLLKEDVARWDCDVKKTPH